MCACQRARFEQESTSRSAFSEPQRAVRTKLRALDTRNLCWILLTCVHDEQVEVEVSHAAAVPRDV